MVLRSGSSDPPSTLKVFLDVRGLPFYSTKCCGAASFRLWISPGPFVGTICSRRSVASQLTLRPIAKDAEAAFAIATSQR